MSEDDSVSPSPAFILLLVFLALHLGNLRQQLLDLGIGVPTGRRTLPHLSACHGAPAARHCSRSCACRVARRVASIPDASWYPNSVPHDGQMSQEGDPHSSG